MNRRSWRVDLCNSGFRRILLPGTAVAATTVDVGGGGAAAAAGGGLLSERRECGEVATSQRTLYTSASSDQCSEGRDELDAN